jgi:squalene synthase HpnC
MTQTLLREGRAAARRATRAHDENFPVAFLLAPRAVRADMRAVYAFCRATDDLGDEGAGGPADCLAALDAWEADLRTSAGRRRLDGGTHAGPRGPAPLRGAGRPDPRLAAVADVIARRELDLDPFLRLIEANRMDQRRSRWDTFDDLLDYCRHSATPVGEMVLGVLGYRDPWRMGMSDATCIGLQLVNFWQDIARDLRDRDRIYLPRRDMERFDVAEEDLRRPEAGPAVRELIAFEVERARAYLLRGEPLYRVVPRRVALDIRMFSAGGLALCDAIARQGYDTLRGRPAPGRRGRARIAIDALRRALGGGS